MKILSEENFNKLKKSDFLVRTKSCIFICLFYVIYLSISILINIKWTNTNWWYIPFYGNFFLVLLIIPIIYFSAKEISNLCFFKNKIMLILTIILLMILPIGVSISINYIKWFYLFNSQNSINISNDIFIPFFIILLSLVLLIYLISLFLSIVMLKNATDPTIKTVIWYPVLILIINLFFIAFFYLLIIHLWYVIVCLFLISNLTDMFSYLSGKFFGKHKFAKNTSPKKTWEGVVFGCSSALSIVTIFYCIAFFCSWKILGQDCLYTFIGCQINGGENYQTYFWALYIFITICLMLISINGDLFFSLIKRKYFIKDFSNLIPGHGGILDRLDALTFVFIIFFINTIIFQLIAIKIFGSSNGIENLWNMNNLKFAF